MNSVLTKGRICANVKKGKRKMCISELQIVLWNRVQRSSDENEEEEEQGIMVKGLLHFLKNLNFTFGLFTDIPSSLTSTE